MSQVYEIADLEQWDERIREKAAYLGKELKKAEIALSLGNSGYYQE
jgi:hypothetical protein